MGFDKERVQDMDFVDESRRLRSVRVRAVHDVSSTMRRLVLAGEDLATLRVALPCEWAKIFLPRPSHDAPQVGRAYTLRDHRPGSNEISIDVVLHDEGPLSSWARDACIGDEVFLAGPRGGYAPDPASEWVLLVADASALPAMASILELVPAHLQVHLFVLADNSKDLDLLPAEYRQRCAWSSRDADHILELVRATEVPAKIGEVWAAGEAGLIRALRKHFLVERKLPKNRVHCAGYWKRGSQDHRDSPGD